jgi:hypothetical protein
VVTLSRGGAAANPGTRTVATTTGRLTALMGSDGAYVILQRQDPADPNLIRLSVQPFAGGEERPIGSASVGIHTARSRTVDGKGLVVLDRDAGGWRITGIDLASGRKSDLGTLTDSGDVRALEVMGDGSLAWQPGGRESVIRVRTPSGEIRSIRTPDVDTVLLEDSPFGTGLVGWGFSVPNGDSIVIYHVPPGGDAARLLTRSVFDYISGMRWLPDGNVELVINETPSTAAFYRLALESGRLERQGTIPLNFIESASISNAGDRVALVTVVPTLDAWVMKWQ